MVMQQWHALSNNDQAQLHTHVSVPYWSPDVWLGLELLRDIQFELPAILDNSLTLLASYQSATIVTCVMNALTWPEVGVATQKFSGVLRVPVARSTTVSHRDRIYTSKVMAYMFSIMNPTSPHLYLVTV